MERLIKGVLISLLLLCLLDMPYGFYQLVRFIAMVGFGILAFKANEEKKQLETLVYVGLAILFQPLLKISLGRELWNVVDLVVALGLLFTIAKK